MRSQRELPKNWSSEEFEHRLDAIGALKERRDLLKELFKRIRARERKRKLAIENGIFIGFITVIIGGLLLFPVPSYFRVFKRNPQKHTLLLMIVLIGLSNGLALLNLPVMRKELTFLIVFNFTVLTVGGLYLYLLRLGKG